MNKFRIALEDDENGRVEHELLRMFATYAHIGQGVMQRYSSVWHPPMDMYEREAELVLVIEVAGLSVKDFVVVQDRDVLTVRGQRREIGRGGRPTYHCMEINYGEFERSVKLPERFVGGKIRAVYRDGFLRLSVSLPDSELQQTKEIEVE